MAGTRMIRVSDIFARQLQFEAKRHNFPSIVAATRSAKISIIPDPHPLKPIADIGRATRRILNKRRPFDAI